MLIELPPTFEYFKCCPLEELLWQRVQLVVGHVNVLKVLLAIEHGEVETLEPVAVEVD